MWNNGHIDVNLLWQTLIEMSMAVWITEGSQMWAIVSWPWGHKKEDMSQTHFVKKLSAMLFIFASFFLENELSPMRFILFF